MGSGEMVSGSLGLLCEWLCRYVWYLLLWLDAWYYPYGRSSLVWSGNRFLQQSLLLSLPLYFDRLWSAGMQVVRIHFCRSVLLQAKRLSLYCLFSKRKYMNYIRGERMEGSTFWNRGITHTCDRLAVWI